MLIAAFLISLAGILTLLAMPPHEAVAALMIAVAIFFDSVWFGSRQVKRKRSRRK